MGRLPEAIESFHGIHHPHHSALGSPLNLTAVTWSQISPNGNFHELTGVSFTSIHALWSTRVMDDLNSYHTSEGIITSMTMDWKDRQCCLHHTHTTSLSNFPSSRVEAYQHVQSINNMMTGKSTETGVFSACLYVNATHCATRPDKYSGFIPLHNRKRAYGRLPAYDKITPDWVVHGCRIKKHG